MDMEITSHHLKGWNNMEKRIEIVDGKEVVVWEEKRVQDRYTLIKDEMYISSFHYDIMGENDETTTILYNTKNSGSTWRENFLDYPTKDFSSQEEMRKYAEENGFKYFGTLGTYRENGYDGVRIETENPYNVVANNWVEEGRNQNLYTIFTNKKDTFKNLKSLVSEYLNYGFYGLTLYDNFEDDQIEHFALIYTDYSQMIDDVYEAVKDYGFTKDEVRDLI